MNEPSQEANASPAKGWALITGASAGIGEELAIGFARSKIPMILVARRADRLEDLALSLRAKFGVEVSVEPADLTDANARARILERVTKSGRFVEYLVNNAGFGTNGAFWELDRGRELAQIELNIGALVDLTRMFLPRMVELDRGRVLNIASTAAFQAGPLMSTYYATKAFVVSFTEGLAGELEGTKVSVTAYCPGATQSEFASIAGNDATPLFQSTHLASARDVAQDALAAMHKGRTVAVHGALNGFLAWSNRFVPRATAARVAKRLNRRTEG